LTEEIKQNTSSKMTIKFLADTGSETAGIYEVRLIRK